MGSVSAYITFANEKSLDAYYAILAVDGFSLGGRTIKVGFFFFSFSLSQPPSSRPLLGLQNIVPSF